MVQGLADPGQTLGQSSIQALFLKFSVPSTPHTGGTTTRVIPVEWNPNLKKHPCFEELTTTFFPTLNSPWLTNPPQPSHPPTLYNDIYPSKRLVFMKYKVIKVLKGLLKSWKNAFSIYGRVVGGLKRCM
jgi:hypothetical protein